MSDAAAPSVAAPVVAAIVLAAGRSTRMGANKLLAVLDGRALVLHAVDAALASRAGPVIVVVGHEADAVRARLGGRAVTVVENRDYRAGLSGSLRAGVAAVPAGADAALVLLGDMPAVGPALIDRVIAAFDPACGRDIVMPARDGRHGHPVLWGRRFFAALGEGVGDAGGRALLLANAGSLARVAVSDDAAFLDVDTPAALASVRARGL